jgi:HEAT repeat protein
LCNAHAVPYPISVRKSPIDKKVARLAEMRSLPDSPELRRELKRFLEDKSPHVVTRAANQVGDRGFVDLESDLEANYDRFTIDPTKNDKGCVAKTAIVKNLVELERGSAEIFLRGLHHVQMEPGFGGPVDTAVELRSYSAMGLATTNYTHRVLELVTALTDPESPVRRAAVQALGSVGGVEIEPVLRLKALHGDPELQIVSEALEVLLVIAPGRSVPFVKGFLDSSDEDIAQAAALALGAARCEEGFDLLKARLESYVGPELTRTLLLSISMLRREQPMEFLLEQLEKAPSRNAEGALHALAIHRHDESVQERVKARLDARKDSKELLALFESLFD